MGKIVDHFFGQFMGQIFLLGKLLSGHKQGQGKVKMGNLPVNKLLDDFLGNSVGKLPLYTSGQFFKGENI